MGIIKLTREKFFLRYIKGMKKIYFIILGLIFFIQSPLKAEVAMIGVVDGMVCMACQAKVEKELKAATGEVNVEVSWPEGVAFINFENNANFSEEDFKKVIEDAGFAVGKVATLNEKIIDPKSGLISLNKF